MTPRRCHHCGKELPRASHGAWCSAGCATEVLTARCPPKKEGGRPLPADAKARLFEKHLAAALSAVSLASDELALARTYCDDGTRRELIDIARNELAKLPLRRGRR